jgi:uncharacterized membrane protein (DUF2068 family)
LSDEHSSDPDAGLRLIVGYKLTKAGAELLGGLALLCLAVAGYVARFREYLVLVRQHAVEAWVLQLARFIESETTVRHALVLAGALVLDGLFTALQAWGLHRRYAWGSWLVVIATAGLLPFEIVELVRRATLVRIAFLIVNVAIVMYLVRRQRRLGPA